MNNQKSDVENVENLTGIIDPIVGTFFPPRLGVTVDLMNIKYWDCDGTAEELRFTDQDEAIADELDNFDVTSFDDSFLLTINGHKYPRTVTVYGYAPFKITLEECKQARILERFLEWLDEQYKFQDTEDPTPKMRAAEQTFIKEVVSEYNVTMAEQVTSVEVDTHKWILKNKPHWLNGN